MTMLIVVLAIKFCGDSRKTPPLAAEQYKLRLSIVDDDTGFACRRARLPQVDR